MAGPIVLYSTNTWISYGIAQRYYQEVHFVWCSPFCCYGSIPGIDTTTPPSSSPMEIYRSLRGDVLRGDRHSSKIQQNRIGLLRGAAYKREAGIIDETAEREIGAIVEHAECRDFRPLLYIIPYAPVVTLLRKVPVQKRAHPLSDECVIDALPRACFDVLEMEL